MAAAAMATAAPTEMGVELEGMSATREPTAPMSTMTVTNEDEHDGILAQVSRALTDFAEREAPN